MEILHIKEEDIKRFDYKILLNNDYRIDDKKVIAALIKIIRKDIRTNKIGINNGRFLLGKLEFQRNNYEKAVSYLNSVYLTCENKYIRSEVLLLLAEIEYENGNYEVAKGYCYNSLNSIIERKKVQVFSLLERIAVIEHKYDEALKYCDFGYKTTEVAYFLVHKVQIYIRKHEYEKAFEVLMKILEKGYDVVEGYIDLYVLYLCKKLNVFIFDYDFSNSLGCYSFNQFNSYDLDYAVEHTKRHLQCNEKRGNDYLDNRIDIYIMIEKVKEMLDDKYKIPSIVTDVYVIPYPNIGIKGANFLKVVTIPNTHDIITMYPVANKCLSSSMVLKK